MELYADIILPVPLDKPFTYGIPTQFQEEVVLGKRVVVPFGKSKFHTGIVYKVHRTPPQTYEVKPIEFLLDLRPTISEYQLQLWDWMSSYYLVPLGSILKAALPSLYLLESQTILEKNEEAEIDWPSLSEDEHLILEALEKGPLTFDDVLKITGKKTVGKSIGGLLSANYIFQQQLLKEVYKPKMEKQLRLHPHYLEDGKLDRVFERVKNAAKQEALILGYLSDNPKGEWKSSLDLRKKWGGTSAIVQQLVKKELFEIREIQIDRLQTEKSTPSQQIELTTVQKAALEEISVSLQKKAVVLLEGITGSGKTALYIKQIQQYLETGKQVLYLLPEISLTTQIVSRLQEQFPGQLAVYHSKFNPQERAEIWQHVLKVDRKAQLIIGARSAIFLPFQKLGLVVVDEEHENSYKQIDPAPRYQARDSIIYLANKVKAKVVLGSATPSIETTENVQNKKYGYVKLTQRYGGVSLPKIELINLKQSYKKKKMKGMFSDSLISSIQETLNLNKQVILFQNRRGYAPFLECVSCGHSPQCVQCDVSLTYHQISNQLKCHYCGYSIPMPNQCNSCGMLTLNTKGVGTQQIENQINEFFPEIKVGRMDWDSTRGKWDFDKIIESFEKEEVKI